MKDNLYSNVRKVRELRGYTQDYVAIQLGISQRAYSKIENNQTKLDWHRIEKISHLFGMTPVDLIVYDTPRLSNSANVNCIGSDLSTAFQENLLRVLEEKLSELKDEMARLRDLVETKNSI
ncbi:helix-turn-helix domain-containing protein [Flavobacterium saliperosum]|uniref:Transcriptional regulator, contains XRE-family HTH domain n=1 Tax=Flavobacterium saliperosum TaxID=329186 RepID=A0A1G4V7V2_9FLAO|nr:helix-turn-helix transcriptional regulator [Flavobacterium saliperosum]SCX02628.1 Transcriptional regulator, contains XRE-family HTH domain [Flavobacterium saliperosum]